MSKNKLTNHQYFVGPTKGAMSFSNSFWFATCDLSDLGKLSDDDAKAILNNCETHINFPKESRNTKT